MFQETSSTNVTLQAPEVWNMSRVLQQSVRDRAATNVEQDAIPKINRLGAR
jgi:hypothetical protein